MDHDNQYTDADLAQVIALLRASGDYTADELAGMEKLAAILKHLNAMSPEDIEAAVKRYYRSV